ncbi:MAG: Mov34/MPN/PAD-1 family protein [Nitrososphaerales archaeon]
MWRHVKLSLPEECCGFLLGEIKDMRHVRKVVRADNVAKSSRETKFVIDPSEFMKVEKSAQQADLNIIGIYHSHPNGRAEPSGFDLEVAWPSYSYVILSVLRGKPFKILSWVLDDDRRGFNSEEIVIL